MADPILQGDVILLASVVMDDEDNGGGGPSGNIIPDGGSNGVFNDISELDRSNGDVSIRQTFLAVRTNNTATFMGANIIVSKPPNDDNVAITLAKVSDFARRTEIANAIESYLIQASEWSGYLLENHVVGMAQIQLFQRVGSAAPAIGRTLCLIYQEGTGTERRQYVRITRAVTETRTFTMSVSGGFVDYQADVIVCDLSDRLTQNFPGSPPSRIYTRDVTKTIVRDTTVADAAQYFGATRLTVAGEIGEAAIKVESVYSQLVPSARTESVALDQRPASVRNLVLATAPRQVEVGQSPHTHRIKIGQENRRSSYTDMLRPFPAPGTVAISYMALGNWYTVWDDGNGAFTGAGAGQVVYTTGSVSITLQEMPDVGSEIILQWGEKVAYTNRSGSVSGFRKPEFEIVLDHDFVIIGSLVVTWLSGGVTKTATDNGTGGFTGDATGTIIYHSGRFRIRPTAFPDPGAEFNIEFDWAEAEIETFSGLTPDSGGFVSVSLAEQATPGTVAVRWVTSRFTNNTAGSTAGTNNQKNPAYHGSSGVFTPDEITTSTVSEPPPATTTNSGWNFLSNTFPGGTALHADY